MKSRLRANTESCPTKRHYDTAEEAAAMAERRSARIGEPLRAYICKACGGHAIGHPTHWKAKAREAEVRARWDVIRAERRVVSQPTTRKGSEMPIGRKATDQGTGGDVWLPCPIGMRRFDVGDAEVSLSPFKTPKGEDQYRVRFPLSLSSAEYERAQTDYDGEIPEGAQISGKCNYTCGLTLGWIDRAGTYNTTRLADFLVTLLGTKQQAQVRKHLMDGGGPFVDPSLSVEDEVAVWNTWFQWFSGAAVWGTVTHRADKVTPGKVWSDFGGPMAVGSLPGQPEPDYQAWGRGKLRMLLLQEGANAANPDPEPEPASAAQTVAATVETTGPAAEMSDEEKTAFAAKYAEIFGKQGVPA